MVFSSLFMPSAPEISEIVYFPSSIAYVKSWFRADCASSSLEAFPLSKLESWSNEGSIIPSRTLIIPSLMVRWGLWKSSAVTFWRLRQASCIEETCYSTVIFSSWTENSLFTGVMLGELSAFISLSMRFLFDYLPVWWVCTVSSCLIITMGASGNMLCQSALILPACACTLSVFLRLMTFSAVLELFDVTKPIFSSFLE